MPAPPQTFHPAGLRGDNRHTTQPSRKWLITPDKHHGDRHRRPQSARSARSPREIRNSNGSIVSTGSVPGSSRHSSEAAKPNPVHHAGEPGIDRCGAHAERAHGRWGGDGTTIGAASGHGFAKDFPKAARHQHMHSMFDRELARSKSLDARGPQWPETPRTAGHKFEDKISRTAWNAPPGYSGHVPGVHVESVGETFHRASKTAAKNLAKYRGGGAPSHEKDARWLHKWDSGGYSPGTEIPGYQGYMPGVYPGNLISSCKPRAVKARWCPERDGPKSPFICMSQDNEMRL